MLLLKNKFAKIHTFCLLLQVNYFCLFLFLVSIYRQDGPLIHLDSFCVNCLTQASEERLQTTWFFKNICLQFMVLDTRRLRDNGISTTYALALQRHFLTEIQTTWCPLKFKYVHKFKFWNKERPHTQNSILSKKTYWKNKYNFFLNVTTKESLLSPDIATISLVVAKGNYTYWQGRKGTIILL